MNEDLQPYKQYAEDCISGKEVCSRYLKLAAKRYLSFFDKYEFRKDKIDKMIRFIENITLFEGKFHGQKLKLLPFQKFIIYGSFGFYYHGTEERVCKHVLVEIGRKQAKSTLSAAIALYWLIGEGEHSAEIDICANSKEQARILFRMACELSKLMDKSNKHIQRTINRVKFPKLNSFIQVLAADTTKLDGFGASLFVEDEFHAAKDTKLYDVLASSQGSRFNPMSIVITSAGYEMSYPYYSEIRKSAIDMLQGLIQNDSLFALIFCLDPEDDFRDESVWKKSMPGLDVMVPRSYVRDRIQNIQTQPSSEVDVKIKQFGIWVQSQEVWIPDNVVFNSFESIDLEDFKDEDFCYCGIDLASVSDMTAISIMIPPNEGREKFPDKYIFKSWCFLPEDTIQTSPNSELYKKAINCGHLLKTPGNCTDYDFILKQMIENNEKISVEKVLYDSWNSTQFAINATEAGMPMEPFSQSIGNFNKATKEFERLILSDKIVIDGNVITRWCFQNATLKQDFNENAKPIKPSKNQKIDCVIAMLQALGGFLISDRYCYYVQQ